MFKNDSFSVNSVQYRNANSTDENDESVKLKYTVDQANFQLCNMLFCLDCDVFDIRQIQLLIFCAKLYYLIY